MVLQDPKGPQNGVKTPDLSTQNATHRIILYLQRSRATRDMVHRWCIFFFGQFSLCVQFDPQGALLPLFFGT